MWNMIIAAVSQVDDPAKILTDAYVAHVVGQGGVVDYARVYAMYRDEYLTDPDKDKMLYWFDFRGGIKFSSGSIITNIYSLLPPYTSNSSTINSVALIDNERIENGYLTGIYVGEKLNPLATIGCKIVNKLGIVKPITDSSYSFITYANNSAYYHSLIGLTTTSARRRSIIGFSDNTNLDNQPTTLYPDGIHITTQIIDIVNKTSRLICPTAGVDRTVTIPEDKTALQQVPTASGVGLRIWGFAYAPNYWLKYYSL